MIGKAQALEQAKKIPVPRNSREYVRMESVEVLMAWLELHAVKRTKWDGEYLVILRDEDKDDTAMKVRLG